LHAVDLGESAIVRKLSSGRAIREKPEIIITEEVDTAASSPATPSPPAPGEGSPPPPPDGTSSNATSIAQKIDEALDKEFGEDTKQITSEAGKTFNETVQREEVCSKRPNCMPNMMDSASLTTECLYCRLC
jgi:hypothetical protein